MDWKFIIKINNLDFYLFIWSLVLRKSFLREKWKSFQIILNASRLEINLLWILIGKNHMLTTFIVIYTRNKLWKIIIRWKLFFFIIKRNKNQRISIQVQIYARFICYDFFCCLKINVFQYILIIINNDNDNDLSAVCI